MRKSVVAACSIAVLMAGLSSAQDAQNPQSMSGMDMSKHDMSQMPAKDTPDAGPADAESGVHVMHSMESHHMDMGPHMKMTALRDPKPGDEERAQKVVEAARGVADKYRDYHTALNDGFQIFLPNVPQKIYHFTNYKYAFDAAFSFSADRPTSLLYEKHADDYKLVGVMYTAPKRFTEADLDQRIPLSIAQWHEHVNLCMPPEGRKQEALLANAKFGLRGSIATKQECDANGGTFRPLIFNWMVHLYPLEKNEADVWAVDRGRDHGHGD
jgi:hypothetical protein